MTSKFLRFDFKQLSKLSIFEINKLKPLTISDDSHLSALLSWAHANFLLGGFEVKLKEFDAYVTIAYKEGIYPIGWAVAHASKKKINKYFVSIFVKEEFRRSGFGKQIYKNLIENIARFNPGQRLEYKHDPFDNQGKSFFKKVSSLQI